MAKTNKKEIKPIALIEMKNVASSVSENDMAAKLQEMQNEINLFFDILKSDNNNFNPQKAFRFLKDYIKKHERILYSTVSVFVYNLINEDNENQSTPKCDRFGTLLSNIDALIDYTDKYFKTPKNDLSKNEQKNLRIENTNIKRAIVKLWDHVNLAQRQYSILRQSDAEYEKKFEKLIIQFQSKIVGEMNAQLLSMVGIFTALAFILFGGISSLDNVLSELKESHILLLLIVGVGWGIGILNVTFIFLFCIGKMTRLNFKSNQHPEASFFQRYPVVCWTNFILLSILCILLWHFYCYQKGIMLWYEKVMVLFPTWGLFSEFCLIVLIIGLFSFFLAKKTKNTFGNEDE